MVILLELDLILLGSLFSFSLDRSSSVDGGSKIPGINKILCYFIGLEVLFSFIDILTSNINTTSTAVIGLEHILMLVWLTIGTFKNQPQALPAMFFSDLREILLPKISNIIFLNSGSESGSISLSSKCSLQYASSLATEIKNQFLLKC